MKISHFFFFSGKNTILKFTLLVSNFVLKPYLRALECFFNNKLFFKENNWTNINITEGLGLMQDILDCRLTSEISKDYLKYISTFTSVDSYVTRNKYIWKNCPAGHLLVASM